MSTEEDDNEGGGRGRCGGFPGKSEIWMQYAGIICSTVAFILGFGTGPSALTPNLFR